MPKQTSLKEQLRRLIWNHKRSTQYLNRWIGGRFGGRIQDLRDMGYDLKSKRVSNDSWDYWIPNTLHNKIINTVNK